jgi:hypothetical protein
MEHEVNPTAAVIEEAIAVIRGGLGKAELEFVGSLTAPLFWVLRDSSTHKEMMKNGSVFFLGAGRGQFAITAAHVVHECLKDSRSPMFVQCVIGSHGWAAYPFYLGDRIIDAHPEIDIATLHFSTFRDSNNCPHCPDRIPSNMAPALG